MNMRCQVYTLLITCGFAAVAAGYTANLTLYNETGSKAFIQIPGGQELMKLGLHAQRPLWQLNPDSDDPIIIKFKNKADYALMHKTFRIKPGDAKQWRDVPNGRLELRRGETTPLTASVYYEDADGVWKEAALEVS